MRLGALVAAQGGEGGIWYLVEAPSGSWTDLRTQLLAPPFAPLSVAAHTTVLHPRTSNRDREAAVDLRNHRIEGEVTVREILFTETSPTGMRILERFPLVGRHRVRFAAGLLRRNRRLLLCHRHPGRTNYPNVWDLPGGHVEHGETIVAALRRELREELEIRVKASTSPWEIVHVDGIEMHVFLIDTWVGEPRNAAPAEHDKIRWVDPIDISALDLAHPSYDLLLRRAAEH